MKYKAILFDMDGTLLPMDMDEFTNGYFKFLAKKMVPFNLEPKLIITSIWAGVKAMMKNDGSMTNAEAFWKVFTPMTGATEELIGDTLLEFYANEFNQAKIFTKENPLAKRAVEISRSKAEKVILATNPLFPMVGQKTRMSWMGLCAEDFDLVSSYEDYHYCKPNPNYFVEVLERAGLKAEECLFVGNDEYEDMYAGSKAGLDCYLVTDTMIPSPEHPWEGKKGSFAELIEFLENL